MTRQVDAILHDASLRYFFLSLLVRVPVKHQCYIRMSGQPIACVMCWLHVFVSVAFFVSVGRTEARKRQTSGGGGGARNCFESK